MLENLKEELKIIADVLEGRVEAFESLVRKYQRELYFLVFRLVRKAEEADDITQQAFLKAFKSLKSFRGEASFKTWLSKIALNLVRTEMKKSQKYFVEYDDEKSKSKPFVLGKLEKESEQDWLKKILDRLPSTQKEVLILRIYEEKSFQEIAELTNSKEGTVKVNFHHALKQLKAWYEEKEEVL